MLEHPYLVCPWCQLVDWEREARAMHMDPSKDPVAVIKGCRARRLELAAQLEQVRALRSRAAREILRRDDREQLFAQLRTSRAVFMGWAVRDSRPAVCAKGHVRSSHGYRIQTLRGKVRWGCKECDREDPEMSGLTDKQRERRRLERQAKMTGGLLARRSDPEIPNLLDPLPLGRLAREPGAG